MPSRAYLLTLTAILSLIPLTSSCLQENEEAGIAGSSITSALSFQYATSDQVSSSYLLRADLWEETSGGINVFKHLIEDDYFGLEAATSGAPIQDLAFQLSKSTTEFKNYLGFDGLFSSQNLSINLPKSIFFTGMSLAEQSMANVDLNKFTYSYRMANSDIEVDAIFTVDNIRKTVTVDVNEPGSIIVRPLPNQSTLPDSPTSQSNIFAISAPPLEFQHYHDKNPSLRTFTWDNTAATADCSLDGGTTYNLCTTPTSLTLTVNEFNSSPFIKVRVIDGGATKTAELDLNDPSNNLKYVKFYTCTVNATGGNLGTISIPTSNSVVCLNGGSYTTSALLPGPIYLNGKVDVVIIGDHIDRPVINSSITIFDASQSSQATNIVIANLVMTLNSGGIQAIKFNNSSFSGSNPSNNTVSNVQINLESNSLNTAIFLGEGQNTTILNTKIASTTGKAGYGMEVDGAVFNLKNSEITLSAVSKNAITVYSGDFESNNLSLIENSVLSTQNTSLIYSPIKVFAATSPRSPKNLSIKNSIISSATSSIIIGDPKDLILENNIFKKLNLGSTAPSLSIDSNYNYFLRGSQNIYCAEVPENTAFSMVLNSTGVGVNQEDFETPVSFSLGCPN